jgi:hypothetical protein
MHENVVTAALPSQIEAERVGKAEQIVEPDIEIAGFDPRPGLARVHELK